MSLDKWIKWSTVVVVFVFVSCSLAYAFILACYAFPGLQCPIGKNLFTGNKLISIGAPVCATAAFVLVVLLERTSRIADSDKPLGFKAFGLEFSGPAAPATLWIVTYLAMYLPLFLAK